MRPAPRVLLASLLLCTAALAGERVIQVDGFTGTGAVTTSISLPTYAGGGMVFSLDAGEYPITIVGVEIFCAPAANGHLGDVGAYLVDIWSEPDGGFPPLTSYGDLYSASGAGAGLTASLSVLNRFPLSTPVLITGGAFLIGVREQLDSATDGTTLAMDVGPAVPGRAWWFDGFGYWYPISDGGVSPADIDRNWIIRAVLWAPDDGGVDGGTLPDGGSLPDGGAADGGGTPDGGTQSDGGNTLPDGGSGLRIDSVTPSQVHAADTVDVTITGAGFDPNVQILIGGRAISPISPKSGSVVVATIAAHSLTVGTYDVVAINSNGDRATLPQALTVLAGSALKAGCSCNGLPGAPTALVMGLLVLLRRRSTPASPARGASSPRRA